MSDHLAGRRARRRKADAKNNVIETCFEQLQQRFTGDTTFLQGFFEHAAELRLHESVLVTQLCFSARPKP